MKRELFSLASILILIFASLNFALVFIPNVEALPTVEAATLNTCAWTERDDFCVESEDIKDFNGAECKAGYLYQGKRVTDASVTDCQQGTCVPGDGTQCLTDKSKIECTTLNGRWDSLSLDSVPECQTGCCNVANAVCQVDQKTVCVNGLAGGDEGAFTPGVTDINACNNLCRPADAGCCNQGGGVYTYSVRSACQGTFLSGTFCSGVLGSNAQEQSYQACGNGDIIDDAQFDVYWYDNKGNMESVVDNCDYPDEFCVDPDGARGEPATCQSTACVEQCAECSPSQFLTGDSLCSDVSPGHYANDERSYGIRPYRLTCQWGVIEPDQTIEDRSKVCVEQTVDALDSDGDTRQEVHAQWIDNNWEACLNECGDSEGWLPGSDIFAYTFPMFTGLFLTVAANKPCIGGGGDRLTAPLGEVCEDIGKVTLDDGSSISMCGAPQVFAGDEDSYDNDLWAPIGSCGPRYPPTVVQELSELNSAKAEKQCGNCGGGADGWVNLCTEQECNALGDCQFEESGPVSSGTLAAGGIHFGTCTSLALLAQFVPLPGAKESFMGTAAAYCIGVGASLGYGAMATGIALGYTVGANAAARVDDPEEIRFELTEEGKARLQDVVKVSRVVKSATEENVADATIKEGDLIPPLAVAIVQAGGRLYPSQLLAVLDSVLPVGLAEGAYNSIVNGLGVVFANIASAVNIFTVGEALQTGSCVPEKSYNNNKQCEQCGAGDGQWWCTQARCGILGAVNVDASDTDPLDANGNCRWVEKEDGGQNDGLCLPLSPSDALPPQINSVNVTFYDPLGNLKGTHSSASGRLDVSNVGWDVTNASLTITTTEPAICGYSKLGGKTFEEGVKFGEVGYPLEHTTGVDFDASDKANPDFRVYLRCQDINGNTIINDNNYLSLKFQERPDTEAPDIERITPEGGLFASSTTLAQVSLVAYDENGVNECKYEPIDTTSITDPSLISTDVNYEEMTGLFTKTSSNVLCPERGISSCDVFETTIDLATLGETLALEGLGDVKTYFFNLKCKDTGGNVMQDARMASLTIVPNFILNITEPNVSSQLWDPTPTIRVETNVPTFCTYTIDTSSAYNFSEVVAAGVHTVEHNITLTSSQSGIPHTLAVHCEDPLSGNEQDSSIIFYSMQDIEKPAVKKIYTEGNFLNLLLSEKSSCEYSTETLGFIFNGGEGTLMVASDDGTLHRAGLSKEEAVYYIKCRDEFTNELTLTVYP